jgi:Fe-S-cluster containining protein
MSADIQETATADVELAGDGWRMRVQMTVPMGPTRLRYLLPMVQSFTNTMVDLTAKAVEEQGEKISCKKGCGACCRQLVPLAETEARHIHELVEQMPEPRRSEVRGRFADACRRLAEAGVLRKLLGRDHWTDEEASPLGIEYFRAGVPCPFLEEESCSIYPDRPLACRQYLVTSLAENCARPTPETVKCVPMPLKVWSAVARCDELAPGVRTIRWVPLVLALEWADAHREEPPPRPGPEFVHKLIENLTRRGVPVPIPSRGGK